MKQVRLGGIAELAFHPDLAQVFDLHGFVIQYRRIKAVGDQQPVDDLAETADPGDQHLALFVDGICFPVVAGLLEAGPQHPVEQNKQRRRQEHGNRHHQRQQLGGIAAHHVVLQAEADQHKAEFTRLGQPQRQQPAIAGAEAEGARHPEHGRRLGGHQTEGAAEHQWQVVCQHR